MENPTDKRLIEVAFPLKQTSLDSVHEKNVRHGHISTLHIWPARRPLAACRAALIATLLPDPGDDEERAELLERLGGHVVERRSTRRLSSGEVEEIVKEETEGGILHWGRESGPDLDWFREKIREAYDGRAPRVLDPFAGGGAIPLEAMRLGCEATAVDINPVAWFILKCTLEYPQRLAGQTRPLPEFVQRDRAFMESFFKARGLTGAALEAELEKLGLGEGQSTAPLLPGMETAAVDLEADLAWHVRAWGTWVLDRAREDLALYYPVVDGKPAVAYLWARTMTCKNCRATIPLLKTTWLCQKPKKRVVLNMVPNEDKTGVIFGIDTNPPRGKDVGKGTMSRAGVVCPCCGSIMTKEDIKVESRVGRMDITVTAVITDGENGKEYRLPLREDLQAISQAKCDMMTVYANVPFGLPSEHIVEDAKRNTWCVQYGVDQFFKLFTARQLLALGTLVRHTRSAYGAARSVDYAAEWADAIVSALAICIDRLADRNSTVSWWQTSAEKVGPTFTRFALPMTWDFCEIKPWADMSGGYSQAVEWVAKVDEHLTQPYFGKARAQIHNKSATVPFDGDLDLVLTDPPYYDAIGYSVLMDFYYVWLRRTLVGILKDADEVFANELAPKWDQEANDGELVDDASRFSNDREKSKAAYEDGMARVFGNCCRALKSKGRLVVVFANKQPDAWETLVSAIIRAGFVVDGSWPIETERVGRVRSYASAALSSSVWLVCKKRTPTARPGWDNRVLAEMRERIAQRLQQFWEAGIRGPDFVWSATGPALEAYSQYPAVRKANQPGEVMGVGEFLVHVRRMVVDYVVGRVLSAQGGAVEGLDDLTTYYLLHRHDFGLDEAPAGAVILYALSCNLSDRDLAERHDLLDKKGSTLQLKPWSARPQAGYDPVLDAPEASGVEVLPLPGFELPAPELRELPLIDQVHRLMHLWRGGDVTRVNAYLDARGLRRSALFRQLLQALIELAPAGGEERALLESLSNHLGGEMASQTTVQGRF